MLQGIFNKIETVSEIFKAWEQLESVLQETDDERIIKHIKNAQNAVDTVIIAATQDLVNLYRASKN
ncbi:MAG: hypothetical protein IJT73_03540 [Selenomonadaceae bacterium]|nr:hypothetical protein [Selenomonadaceae bacterium]